MKADGDKFAPNHHKMFSSLSVSLSPSLCLCWPDLLKQKDTEIMSLLEEKVQLFRGMWEGLNTGEEVCRQGEPFFRSACGVEPPRGASVMKDALQEGKREKESVYSASECLTVKQNWKNLIETERQTVLYLSFHPQIGCYLNTQACFLLLPTQFHYCQLTHISHIV